MNENFFIFTSNVIINRAQIVSVEPIQAGADVGIKVSFVNTDIRTFFGEEAFDFLTSLSPGITIGHGEIFDKLKRQTINS